MCGIVGYMGYRLAAPILIEGLKNLEYRGYDSAGISIKQETEILTVKKQGQVSKLEDELLSHDSAILQKGKIGIGHTRWATHGLPNDTNAHPHTSQNHRVTLVHNGVIENHSEIKKHLTSKGYRFVSETDTEVLANLIDFHISTGMEFISAVQKSLQSVIGAYAIVAISPDFPEQMVLARLSSPLVIGVGKDELYIASDATPFLKYTRRVIYLKENKLVLLESNKPILMRDITNSSAASYKIEELDWDIGAVEKGGYESFMQKEIFAQPKAVEDAMRGRVSVEKGQVNLKSIQDHKQVFEDAKRIIFIACGTSWHAGLIGEYMIEEFARIPAETEYASEFRYRDPVILPNDVIISISQSGETADTLAALRLAKSKQAFVYGVCNVVGSSLARESDTGCYTHAGPEIGVASTKAFTTQLTVLFLIALEIATIKKSLSQERKKELLQNLVKLPQKIDTLLKSCEPEVKKISQAFHTSTNFLYLGRGYNFPLALEGALKLKEISYIHAEGYPAAEMKHGPIALIDENMPVVVVISQKNFEKINSNLEEILSRKGRVIVISTRNISGISQKIIGNITIPNTIEPLVPILASIPMQLLSYHIAKFRKLNVDKPRNLAKSVTVE